MATDERPESTDKQPELPTDEPATAAGRHEAAAEPGPRHRDRRAAVLIGVLTALLGFAIAVQLRTASTQDALAGARQDDLVRILDDQNSRAARLRSRISDQQELLARLTAAGGGSAAARAEAQREADALAILTGTAAATGPGVVLTISDPGQKLQAEDLLDVVEELRGAGAEAIQFGPIRVATSSAFREVNGKIVLDGAPLTAPYVIKAIGPAKTMDTAMNIPGGVAAVARTAGGGATVEELERVDINILRAPTTNKYATPVPR
jgi:uncharacterized protein YlxW (UPF0749 family)